MVKVIYDFREGLDKEKIVYRDTSCDCASFWKFVAFVLFSWSFMIGWFALFQYSYISHGRTAFWVYVIVWLVAVISFASWVTYYLIAYTNKKKKLKAEKAIKEGKELKEKQEFKDKQEKQEQKDRFDTRVKNELEMIELQNVRDTEQAFLSKHKA